MKLQHFLSPHPTLLSLQCELPPLLMSLWFASNYQREKDKRNRPSNLQLSPHFDPSHHLALIPIFQDGGKTKLSTW